MFHKAERRRAKLRLALTGTSGSGKTYGALQIAKGIGGKIAMLDTENGSGELYADITDYDVCTLTAPYSPKRYIDIIKNAEKAGYDILIIDSLSHAWSAEGGILDKVDRITQASNSKNSYFAWRDATPEQNSLVEAILTSDMHIITTMRSKTAYEVADVGNGKKAPVKIGLAPIQRAEFEYEFTVVFDISKDKHLATESKDRTGLFDNRIFMLEPSIGQELKTWLEDGKVSFADEKTDEFIDKMQNVNNLDELKDIYKAAYAFCCQFPHREDIRAKIDATKDNVKELLKNELL